MSFDWLSFLKRCVRNNFKFVGNSIYCLFRLWIIGGLMMTLHIWIHVVFFLQLYWLLVLLTKIYSNYSAASLDQLFMVNKLLQVVLFPIIVRLLICAAFNKVCHEAYESIVTKASELLKQWIIHSVGFDNFFFFLGVSILFIRIQSFEESQQYNV